MKSLLPTMVATKTVGNTVGNTVGRSQHSGQQPMKLAPSKQPSSEVGTHFMGSRQQLIH